MPVEVVTRLADLLSVLIAEEISLRRKDKERKLSTLSEISRAIRDLQEIERDARQLDLFYPDITVNFIRPDDKPRP